MILLVVLLILKFEKELPQRDANVRIRPLGSGSSLRCANLRRADYHVAGSRSRSRHVAAGIIRLLVAPFAHELFELGIAAFRQHDPHRCEKIAGGSLGGYAFAFDT